MSKPLILFVCWGNSCRSTFFEAFAARDMADYFDFETAGIEPQGVEANEQAVETLKYEFGIDFNPKTPRSVRSMKFDNFDLIIAADRFVAKELVSIVPASATLEVWRVEDPWAGPLEYKRCAIQIRRKLRQLNRVHE